MRWVPRLIHIPLTSSTRLSPSLVGEPGNKAKYNTRWINPGKVAHTQKQSTVFKRILNSSGTFGIWKSVYFTKCCVHKSGTGSKQEVFGTTFVWTIAKLAIQKVKYKGFHCNTKGFQHEHRNITHQELENTKLTNILEYFQIRKGFQHILQMFPSSLCQGGTS